MKTCRCKISHIVYEGFPPTVVNISFYYFPFASHYPLRILNFTYANRGFEIFMHSRLENKNKLSLAKYEFKFKLKLKLHDYTFI